MRPGCRDRSCQGTGRLPARPHVDRSRPAVRPPPGQGARRGLSRRPVGDPPAERERGLPGDGQGRWPTARSAPGSPGPRRPVSRLLSAPTSRSAVSTYAAGETLKVRAQATGTSPTTVRVKVWKSTTTEPTAWAATATDSTAGLQAPGSIGLHVYLGSSATNAPHQGQVRQPARGGGEHAAPEPLARRAPAVRRAPSSLSVTFGGTVRCGRAPGSRGEAGVSRVGRAPHL